MSVVLTEYLEKLGTEHTPLWIDAWDYGKAVLARGGEPPWGDVGALVAYHRQLQGLVNSDILVIELDSFYQSWLQRSPALAEAMAAKKRLGYALRTLLADTASRAHLREIVDALAGLYPDRPLLLAVPSPKYWMSIAYCQAHGVNEAEVSWDDAESASMYVADYLRNFAACEVAGLLLRDIDGPSTDEEVARYQPVLNVAEHYRWQVVLDGCSADYQPGSAQGVSFCLANCAGDNSCPKISLDEWPGKTEDKPAFVYLNIPAAAVPEFVLDWLQAARNDSA
tara:strand:- start:26 stop:868 length:843 start_codon:yes stop_codon:yes gene_type:complete